jgi:hypothetical protein
MDIENLLPANQRQDGLQMEVPPHIEKLLKSAATAVVEVCEL